MKIDRKSNLSIDQFASGYLEKNIPVIVTDAISRWPAPQMLNINFISVNLGHFEVQIYDDLFSLENICQLQQYLDEYWWVKPHFKTRVPYVRWYAKFKDVDFVWADEAFSMIEKAWALPYFLPVTDYLLPRCAPPNIISPVHDSFPAKGIFISAAGARTRLHEDPWCSDAILCQLIGRKKVLMFRPERRDELTNAGVPIDVENSAPVVQADFDDVLEPAEVLFIPAGWLHHLNTLTNSVSLTWNFVHRSHSRNYTDYIRGGVPDSERAVLQYFSCLR
jgi:hypothetical protein